MGKRQKVQQNKNHQQTDHPQTDQPQAGGPGPATRAVSYLKSFPRPVWLLMVATFVESTGRFMVVPYLSLYMRDAGVSLGTLGLVLGAAPVANVIFGAWGGQLSDRWGRKPVQVLGVALSGLAMFGFAFTGAQPVVLAFLNFLNGMTRTFYRPATSAALADLCPPHKRSEAFALNRISLNAAFGLGPILGVAIFQTAPKAGFIIGGLLNLAVGLYIAFVIPESAPLCARPGPGISSRERPPLVPSLQSETKGRTKDQTKSQAAGSSAWAEIARDGGFWVWTAGMTLVWGSYDLIQSFLPLHLRDYGVPLWTYGTILAINATICVLVQLPASRMLRVAPIAPSAAWSKLAFAVGFIGFAFLRSPAALILSMVILSIGEVWGSAVQVRYIPEHVRPGLMGRYMGLSMVSELGRAAAAPAAGFLMGATGGEAVFLMAAGLASTGGILLYLAGKAQDQRPRLA
jgi:MFS family permease